MASHCLWLHTHRKSGAGKTPLCGSCNADKVLIPEMARGQLSMSNWAVTGSGGGWQLPPLPQTHCTPNSAVSIHRQGRKEGKKEGRERQKKKGIGDQEGSRYLVWEMLCGQHPRSEDVLEPGGKTASPTVTPSITPRLCSITVLGSSDSLNNPGSSPRSAIIPFYR